MKNVLFIFLIFSASISFCQIPQFSMTKDGIEPIVIELPDKTADELYQMTKNWIMKEYSNPQEALKADIKNEEIRIQWYTPSLFVLGSAPYGIYYSFKVQFKVSILPTPSCLRILEPLILAHEKESKEQAIRNVFSCRKLASKQALSI